MEHELPSAPDTPVIEWSTTGGLAGAGGGPDLVVWSDGRVEIGERFAGRRMTGRIEPAALQGLVAAALEDHRFFELDAAAIEVAVDAARRRRAAQASEGDTVEIPLGPPYTDAGTSRIAIAADGRRHEVRCHGLFAGAREYAEVRALGDLRAIEERLLALAEDVARG